MNRKNFKKGMTAVVAAVMVVAQALPAFAYNFEFNTGSTEIHTDVDQYGTYRWASGLVERYPAWYWVDQYCYYFTGFGTYAKNTTTPDGYTVDELGRWTVDGVPQTNDYGHVVIGTDQIYAGKSDDERWLTIRELLEKTSSRVYGDESKVAFISRDDMIMVGYRNGAYGEAILHNTGSGDYISYNTMPSWSDQTLTEGIVTASEGGAMAEKIYKILLGDHVGQEFFNDIRAAAEPLGGPKEILERDENGNTIPYTAYEDFMGQKIPITKRKSKTIQQSGDGINPSLVDWSKWQNRTTDYGKTFSANYDYDRDMLEIKIK